MHCGNQRSAIKQYGIRFLMYCGNPRPVIRTSNECVHELRCSFFIRTTLLFELQSFIGSASTV